MLIKFFLDFIWYKENERTSSNWKDIHILNRSNVVFEILMTLLKHYWRYSNTSKYFELLCCASHLRKALCFTPRKLSVWCPESQNYRSQAFFFISTLSISLFYSNQVLRFPSVRPVNIINTLIDIPHLQFLLYSYISCYLF